MRVLGLSGSLRRDSYNTRLLRVAATALPPGAELEIWDDLAAIPPYNEEDDGERAPAVVSELRSAVSESDAVLIATPEYNSSIPGQLKNVLDWLSRPFPENSLRNKPVAVIGASTGMFGAVWAQAETRKVLKAIGARVVEGELPVARADEAFDSDDRLANAELQERFEELLADLIEQVELREQLQIPQQLAA
jgi:chromate reductase